MRKVIFKVQNNHHKSNTEKNNSNGGSEQKKYNDTSFAQMQNHLKGAIFVI